MGTVNKAWEIYCLDEAAFIRGVAATALTECPNNAAHSVQADSVHEIEAVASEYDPQFYLDYENDNQIKRFYSSTLYRYLPMPGNVIQVSAGGTGDYSSIATAITTVATPGTVFLVAPGTYVESNPISITTGCSVIALAGPENTSVVPTNSNATIFNIGLMARLQGFRVLNASGANGKGVVFNGTGTPGQLGALYECIIANCTKGVEVLNGAPNALNINRVQIATSGTTVDCALHVHDQGQIIGSSVVVAGNPLKTITEGIRVEGAGSQATLVTTLVRYSDKAVILNDDGEYRMNHTLLENNDVNLCVESTGTECKLHAMGVIMRNSGTSEVDVQATDAELTFVSSVVDRKKINNPNKVRINSDFNTNDTVQEKIFRTMTGDIRVGTVEESSKLVCGHGKQYYESMVVYRNTNLEVGTFSDVTEEANSVTSSTFDLFAGTAAGNCCFIGANNMFTGLKVYVTTAITLSNSLTDIVSEYWNGSSWISFGTMCTESDAPFYSVGKQFVEVAESQHVRFGLTSSAPFALKTINGSEKYWIRFRVVNSLSGLPVLEQILLHTPGSTEIGSSGLIEHMGDSRTWAQLPWEVNVAKPANFSPGDQDVYVSSTLGVGRTENQMSSNVTDGTGMVFFVPEDMDCSFPVVLKLAYIGTSALVGDVRMVVRRAVTRAGDTVTTSASGSNSSETSQTLTWSFGLSESNQLKYQEISLDVQDLLPRPQSGNSDLLWIGLERDGGNVADTYAGNLVIVQLTAWYVRWATGGHLLFH